MTHPSVHVPAQRDFVLRIEENALTDGSKTYNVRVKQTYTAAFLDLPAVSYEDAMMLMDRLERAINDHTVLTAVQAADSL